MTNYPCSHDAFVAHVRAQNPAAALPAGWVGPRRLELQRRGLRTAMTFWDLRKLIEVLEEHPEQGLPLPKGNPEGRAQNENPRALARSMAMPSANTSFELTQYRSL